MSTRRRWQDIKAEARRRNPELADPERQARACAELDAYVAMLAPLLGTVRLLDAAGWTGT